MIPYIGGKSYLSKWIIENFPSDYKERVYVEPFGGGGWVLFKKEQSYLEIYNDLNSNLVNLFKVIRDNYDEFQHRAEWSLHSREMYNEARERLKNDKFLSDIEKGMHYAIQQIQSFSGTGGWGYVVTAPKMIGGKWKPFLNRLELINARLKSIQLENLDFQSIIEKYDQENALFYLDPPYVDVEHYYKTNGVDFGRADHHRLAELLKNIKGKFVLSYYEHPLVRELYPGFRVIMKETSKHSAGVTRQNPKTEKPRAKELLIMNY